MEPAIAEREEGSSSRWTALGVALSVLAIAGLGIWAAVLAVQRSQRAEASRARLAPWARSELEWVSESFALPHAQPLVSRATGVQPDGPRPWSAIASEALPAERPVPEDARGAIVELRDDGEVSLHDAHSALDERHAAGAPEDVAWIAVVTERWVENLYTIDEEPIAVQRWDVQLVEMDYGERVARATVEAMPARSEQRRGDLRVEPAELADVVARMLALPARVAPPPPPPPQTGAVVASCIVDRVLLPLIVDPDYDASCLDGANSECLAACANGDPGSCREAAYTLENASFDAARPYYERGCLLRDAQSCTGAMSLPMLIPGAEVPCALRVLDATCAAGDQDGCASWARLSVWRAGADPAAVRARLEERCSALGGYACATLGELLADDELGEADAEAIDAAFDAACATGWTSACDEEGSSGTGDAAEPEWQ